MANINDLRQSDNIVIDMEHPENNHTVSNVSLNSLHNINKKTIIKAKGTNTVNNTKSIANISDIAIEQDEEDNGGVEIRESLDRDILEGENSLFGKYLKEKQEEAEAWIAEKQEEAELRKEEIELNNSDENEISFNDLNEDIKYAESQEEFNINNEYNDYEDNDMEFTNNQQIIENEIIEDSIPQNENIELESTTSTITTIEDLNEEIEDEDLKAEKEAEENDEEETMKRIQKLATEKIKPVSQKLNISSFTINKKPITNTKFLQQQQVKVAKWVLPEQEIIVTMKEFLGSELELLRSFSENNNSISMLTKKYRCIYDHITSPKPSTYEAWLKSTPYKDIDHYYFAVYIACFNGANFIPLDCVNTKCKNTFISDDIPIMDMVKFESDEAKQKFMSIYRNETVNSNKSGAYTTEIIPLSSTIAVAFKEPSIYNLMEIVSVDTQFRQKYSSILEYIPYIDEVYYIDSENQSLTPIGYKEYTDNATKTIKSKIQKYDQVLKSLNIDEFGPLKAYIRAINDRKPMLTYAYPAITCPKCGTNTEEIPASAESMVFTRYQLGALVSTTID